MERAIHTPHTHSLPCRRASPWRAPRPPSCSSARSRSRATRPCGSPAARTRRPARPSWGVKGVVGSWVCEKVGGVCLVGQTYTVHLVCPCRVTFGGLGRLDPTRLGSAGLRLARPSPPSYLDTQSDPTRPDPTSRSLARLHALDCVRIRMRKEGARAPHAGNRTGQGRAGQHAQGRARPLARSGTRHLALSVRSRHART